MTLTNEQILGKKFEIYVYRLFLDLGRKVEKNLTYKVNKESVQIDLKVKGLLGEKIYELKYTKSYVNLFYGNPIDQLLRASYLTNYKAGGIITNSHYSRELVAYAKKKKIKLYDVNHPLEWERERRSLDSFGLIDPLGWILNKKQLVERINKKIEEIVLE